MRNTWLLIKNYFNCFIYNLFRKKNEAVKYGTALIFLLAFGALFVFMFTSLSITTTQEAIKFNEPVLALYITSSMSLMFVLLMTIIKCTTPTKGNDEELLLSLPVSKTNIVVAKVFYDYLFDFFVVLVTLLPSFIVYVVLVKDASIMILVRGILLTVLLPMVSSSLGYFIGLFFNYLSRHFKYYSIIQSILTLIILVVFIVGYYGIAFMADSEQMSGATTIMNLEPIKWMVQFIYNEDLNSLLYIILCSLVPFIISIYVKTLMLGRHINKYKSKDNTLKFKESSPVIALYKREASRYFSLPAYVINSAFGAILLIVIGLILVSLGMGYIDNLLKTAGLNNLEDYYVLIILFITLFSLSTICITSSSISLEGKTLWILKVHPTSTKDIFNAKILFNTTIAFVPAFISNILVCIALKKIIYLPFFILISLVTSFIVSSIGLLMNLIYPKFDWKHEAEPIKQGIAVLVSMGANLLALILPLIVFILLSGVISELIIFVIVITLYIVIAYIIYKILNTKGTKIFLKL